MMTTPEPPDRDERSARRSARRRERSGSPALRLSATPQTLRWPGLDWPAVSAQAGAIHQAALARLTATGLVVDDVDGLQLFRSAGARVDLDARRVWLGPDWLLDRLNHAPARFAWVARHRGRSVTVGAGAMAFAMHGRAERVVDPVRGPRAPTEVDLVAALKLGQLLGSIHAVGSVFSRIENANPAETELLALGAALTLTNKPVVAHLLDRRTAEAQLALIRSASGPEQAVEPRLLGHARAAEPGRWESNVVQATLTCAGGGQAVWIVPAPSPPGEVDGWARQHADSLALAALLQIATPGAPLLLGGVASRVLSIRQTALGQHLARIVSLPAAVEAPPSAPVPGAVATTQASRAHWPALFGEGALLSSAGLVANGLAFSFEQLLIDAEAFAAFGHFLGGFAVDDETLALDEIRAAGPGGHHLDTAHTRARYADAFFTPYLADRLAHETWELAGSWDATTKAQMLWPELLSAYEAPSINAETRRALTETLTRVGTRLV